MVRFVDEVDHTLNLPYTDDFFTAIRTMYNQRAEEPADHLVAFWTLSVIICRCSAHIAWRS